MNDNNIFFLFYKKLKILRHKISRAIVAFLSSFRKGKKFSCISTFS